MIRQSQERTVTWSDYQRAHASMLSHMQDNPKLHWRDEAELLDRATTYKCVEFTRSRFGSG